MTHLCGHDIISPSIGRRCEVNLFKHITFLALQDTTPLAILYRFTATCDLRPSNISQKPLLQFIAQEAGAYLLMFVAPQGNYMSIILFLCTLLASMNFLEVLQQHIIVREKVARRQFSLPL